MWYRDNNRLQNELAQNASSLSWRPFEYCSSLTDQPPGNNLPGIAFSVRIGLGGSDLFELAIDYPVVGFASK
jgi:hypothetical protein